MMFLVVEGPRSVRLVTSAQMITDETLTLRCNDKKTPFFRHIVEEIWFRAQPLETSDEESIFSI